MSDQTTIQCPECGSAINVNDILKHQIENAMRTEFQLKQQVANEKLNEQKEILAKAQLEFESKKEKENELFKERLDKEKKEAEQIIAKKLKAQFEDEQRDSLENLQRELNEKSEKLKDFHQKEAEISRLLREKDEMKEALEAEGQKKLNESLIKERERISKRESEKNELRMKELIKQLEDQKKLTEDMRRKQEQGSMQLQGEVQELAIEEWLADNFPLDTVEEIKKGANGADCLQIVNTYDHQNCGSIYYESKRAKAFSNNWIAKFKEDMAKKGAPLGVIVSEVLPNEMERMGMIDKNLWVCTFQEFKSLSAVLRQSVIAVNNTIVTQSNKGDKMSLLYDYLTGPEFRMQIEAIKDAFIEMQDDLNKEQRAAHSRWKRRQKQIDKVMLNTTGMYGSLRGIAGSSVPIIAELEEENLAD
ncbi:DUF2130 domain-containing protein [Flavimarina sp. Hel_I_48]|uniref:DUF2130 domain-containing protein n=1 Tax=Flavimarina sp. Hel_I_48 TaxID=1392488 RepID=UPI0004DEE2A8|nr:DUF2130 domain-containing protein [Flavimarina sp. Hel_I_48]